jgi:hypothetical protein
MNIGFIQFAPILGNLDATMKKEEKKAMPVRSAFPLQGKK